MFFHHIQNDKVLLRFIRSVSEDNVLKSFHPGLAAGFKTLAAKAA